LKKNFIEKIKNFSFSKKMFGIATVKNEKMLIYFEGKEVGFIFLNLDEIAKFKKEILVLRCERCNRIKNLFDNDEK